MGKSFLVAVLALVGFGGSAGASVVEYCSGTGCGANNQSQFLSDLSAGDLTLQGLQTFTAMTPALTYTDSASGTVFEDFPGSNDLSVSGGVLTTVTGHDDSIVINVPATILAISLTISVSTGLCANDCVEQMTSGFLGFINTGSPTSPWRVTLSPLGTSGFVAIDSFNLAKAADIGGGGTGGTGGGDAETPEVATFVLIGSGLIAMRWLRRVPGRLLRSAQTI